MFAPTYSAFHYFLFEHCTAIFDLRRAIDVAHDAFASWRQTSAKERSVLLRRWDGRSDERIARLSSNVLCAFVSLAVDTL